ncbi:MAG: hypothetical protein AAFU33_08720 [Bacteroidota bacterium]
MEIAEIIVEAIKYILPAVLVLIGMRWVLASTQQTQLKAQQQRMTSEINKQHLTVVLTAYERAVLFCERIQPHQVIQRNPPSQQQPAQTYSQILIQDILGEYEHNVAQQVYIHPEAWEALMAGRDQVIHLIQEGMKQFEGKGSAADLAQGLLAAYQEEEQKINRSAVLLLNKNVRTLFGH